MDMKRRIGILTGGGDCPGLNAVIRAVAKKLMLELGAEVVGIEDSFDGFLDGRWRRLSYDDVSGILTRGGTILGTTNKGDPFAYRDRGDVSAKIVAGVRKLKLEGLVVLGGDGTMRISHRMTQAGVRVVGVPKTIDNDVVGTEVTFGFDSAVRVATEALDALHSTADSHRRIMLVEVMGRTVGWIALHAGVAGGADVILIPEIPHRMEALAESVRRRHARRRFTIAAVAEGAGQAMQIGKQLESATGIEARVAVLGHLQRGGSPTPTDRILASRLGAAAAGLVARRRWNRMVAVRGGRTTDIALSQVAGKVKRVPPGHELIGVARAVGTSFGD